MKKILAALFVALLIALFLAYRLQPQTDTIVLGASLPKSGIMKEWGEGVMQGAQSYFSYAKTQHLLGERTIRFVALDDKYEPELTLKNVDTLLKSEDVFAFFGFVGTPTIKNALSVITQNGRPFVAPFTGAGFLRHPGYKNIVNIRSSYEDEINHLVRYLHESRGITQYGVFYQNDDYGEEVYTLLLATLKQSHLDLVAQGSYKRNTLSISHALHEMRHRKVEAVIMIGAHKANAIFIQRARKLSGFENTLFATVSFGDADAMMQELSGDGTNLLFSQVVPSYDDLSVPVVREYREQMARFAPSASYSFISLEAYIAAKATVAALVQSGENLTPGRFIESIRKLPENSLGGIPLGHGEKHQLLDKTYLFEYAEGAFREIHP